MRIFRALLINYLLFGIGGLAFSSSTSRSQTSSTSTSSSSAACASLASSQDALPPEPPVALAFSRLEGKPSAETEKGIEILEELFDVIRQSGLITNPLDPRRRTLAARKRSLEAQYQEIHSDLETDDTFDEPIIFESLKTLAVASVRQEQQERRFAFIARHRPQLAQARDLRTLRTIQIEELETQCHEELQLMERVDAQLAYLVELSRTQKVIRAKRVDDRRFVLDVGDDILLGYAVYDSLLIGRIIPDRPYEGGRPFILSKEQLTRYAAWLTEVHKWVHDFREVCAALVGAEYIELGQKSVHELLHSSHSISPSTRKEMLALRGDSTCLLLNTVSINLTEHPHKAALKRLFEACYRKIGLRARDGREKKFLTGTYRTNIGVPQLMRLAPLLNKEIKVKALVEDLFGPGSLFSGVAARNGFNSNQTFQQFKTELLRQIHRTLRVPGTGIYDLAGDTQRLETLSLCQCERLLQEYASVRFKRPEARREITRAQKDGLYGGSVEVLYSGGVRKKNIPALIARLKSSHGVQDAKTRMPDIIETLDQLQSELVAKLNSYHALPSSGYYSRRLVDQGIEFFEAYVARVVYQELSCVTQRSIDNSLVKIASIIGHDHTRGCATGFAGRMNDILLCLVACVGNDLEASLAQFKHECYQNALDRIRRGGESSMAMLRVPPALAPILKTRVPSFRARDLSQIESHQAREVLREFVRNYNPRTVYHHCREFLGNKFWELNDAGLVDAGAADDAMYRFLTDLEMGCTRAELDKKYRVNGNPENRWQYAFFQQDLAPRLVKLLLHSEALCLKSVSRRGRAACVIMTPNDVEFSVSGGLVHHRHATSHVGGGHSHHSGGSGRSGLGHSSSSSVHQHYQPTGG